VDRLRHDWNSCPAPKIAEAAAGNKQLTVEPGYFHALRVSQSDMTTDTGVAKFSHSLFSPARYIFNKVPTPMAR
jgi:hypothetical protein